MSIQARPESLNVLITGCGSGIGRTTALFLDRSGHRVYAAVRSQTDADELTSLGTERLTPIIMDVTDEKGISAARSLLEKECGDRGLDALVNNAGMGESGPVESISMEKFRRPFEVNVFGVLAVTQALLPLLRKARGRIVCTTSAGAHVPIPFVSPYCASKAAMESLCQVMRFELEEQGISVSTLDPGQVATRMVQTAGELTQQSIDELSDEQRGLYGRQMEHIRDHSTNPGKDPELVARTIEDALTRKKPLLHYAVGVDGKVVGSFRRLPARIQLAIHKKMFGW